MMYILTLFKSMINLLSDILIYNILIKSLIIFKYKFINPRILKLKGRVIAQSIRNKGCDLRIHGPIEITGRANLKIGDYVRIGKGSYFGCEGGLTIGDNVQISRNVLIYTYSHDINSSAIPYDKNNVYKPITIGNSVWIGMNVTIVPGTVIGDGAVIGIGTVVSGIIPEGSIIVGPKCRTIGNRDMENFQKMKESMKYFGILYPNS